MTSWANISGRSDAASKENGHISMLNTDCMLHLFSFLSFADKISCEGVSKYWRDVSIESWRSVRTLYYNYKMGPKPLIRSVTRLRELKLHIESNDQVLPITRLIRPNPRLLRLTVICSSRDMFNLIHAAIQAGSPNLQDVAFFRSIAHSASDRIRIAIVERLVQFIKLGELVTHEDLVTYLDFSADSAELLQE